MRSVLHSFPYVGPRLQILCLGLGLKFSVQLDNVRAILGSYNKLLLIDS